MINSYDGIGSFTELREMAKTLNANIVKIPSYDGWFYALFKNGLMLSVIKKGVIQ